MEYTGIETYRELQINKSNSEKERKIFIIIELILGFKKKKKEIRHS